MNKLIKPGDPQFGIGNPDKGQAPKQVPVAYFHRAGECPVCEMPVYAHTPFNNKPARIYRTCQCEDVGDARVTVMVGSYDPDFERAALDELFMAYHLLMEKIEELVDDADDDGDGEGLDGAAADGPAEVREQGEGETG